MTRLIQRILFKNKALWAWPGVFLLFVVVVFIWGDISSAQNSHSFMIGLGDLTLPSSAVIRQLISISVLIAIIGLPSHFAENLKPERASLLLSKPISRSELLLSDFGGMLAVSFCYTLISTVLLALLTVIKAGIFPYQFFVAMLLGFPLLLLTFYISIVLFLTLTESYLAGVILGYFITGLSSVFLDIEKFLNILGWEDTLAKTVVVILGYLIPSAGGVQELMNSIFQSGFSAFDGGLFAFTLVTCLPFGLLSYYLFLKKEF